MKKRIAPKAKPSELFWMIWADGYSPPTKKHRSFTEAASEAARLKNKEPGKTFFILKLEAATVTKDNAPVGIRVCATGKVLKVKPLAQPQITYYQNPTSFGITCGTGAVTFSST